MHDPVPHPRTKLTMSLTGSNCSSFSRIRSHDWGTVSQRARHTGTTHSVILHADLGHGVGVRPHNVLGVDQAFLLDILDVLRWSVELSVTTTTTHVTERPPFVLPLLVCLLEDADKVAQVLLVAGDGLTQAVDFSLELLQLAALGKLLVGSVLVELDTVRLVTLPRLKDGQQLDTNNILAPVPLTLATWPSCRPLLRYDFSTLACRPFLRLVRRLLNSAFGCSTVE